MVDNWYLIQFKPNAYKVAERNLNRQGFKTFLPLIDVTRRNMCSFKVTTKPLFTGYMFVKIDRIEIDCNKINNTIGVSKLVSFDGQPRALPKELVSELMGRCDADGKILAPEFLRVGDMVKMSNGPFSNFTANVESIDSTKRVWVIMEIMKQPTRTMVPLESLQLII